jgi:hypothetical protein
MDAFVATSVDYEPGRCSMAEVQHSSVTIRLRNDAPTGLPLESGEYGRADDRTAPEGSTKMLVYLYAPVDATLTSATLDGQPVDLFSGNERGRPVWWNYVTLNRGQEAKFDVKFDEPTVLDVEPRVLTQAMAIDEQTSVKPNATC